MTTLKRRIMTTCGIAGPALVLAIGFGFGWIACLCAAGLL